jgi:hypothetical protein
MKISSSLLKIFLFAGFFLCDNTVFSQGKFEISGGLGIPELFNARVKYGQNIQVGACLGFYTGNWYGNNYADWSVSGEITYHFSGISKYVEQPPWYLLCGLGYYHLPVVNLYEQYNIGLYPRIGRTFNFSEKIGANLDGGIFLPLSMTPDYGPYFFSVLFFGSISLFIRF